MKENSQNNTGRVLSSHFPPCRKAPWGAPKICLRQFASQGASGHPSMLTAVNFYGRDFVISPDVLIPRPETEMVIDAVLNLVGKPYLPGVKPSKAKLPQDLIIVDVGTGSGCIAVTLKLELPGAKVIATDISKKALGVARKNADKLGAEVKFMQSDLLDEVEVTPDLVVANLPYVDENWKWIDKEVLSREPAIALYADNGGLALIYKLIDQVAERGIKHLMLEADPCQHERIITYAEKKKLKHQETRGFILVFNLRVGCATDKTS